MTSAFVLCVLQASRAFAQAAGQGVPATAVTFARDVAPLLQRHCLSCHQPGGSGPFSLLTYDDARARAKQIVAAVEARAMPPWKVRGFEGHFLDDPRLAASDIAMLRRWIDDGAVRGDPFTTNAPPVPVPSAAPDTDWALGPPDLVVHLGAPYRLPPLGPDRLRNFPLPIAIPQTRFVRAWEFKTTNQRAVHHATVMVDPARAARRLDEADTESGYEGLIPLSAQSPDGYFLGWTPGQRPHPSDADLAWRLDPGSDLIIMLHLRPTGELETVDASIALYFTETPPSKVPVMIRLNRQDLDIPAGESQYVASDVFALPVDVSLHALQPHAHYLAKSVLASAALPDGRTIPLIDIPEWDFHWQEVYRLRRPVHLPAGTRLTMEMRFDNSNGNRANPNLPPRRVLFGQRSNDEMADLWLQVTPAVAADRERLVAALRRKLVPQHIDGYRKMIEGDPSNPSLHDDLALLAIEAGDLNQAVAAFAESRRVKPTAASHFNVGNALLMAGRTSEAVAAFRDSLSADASYAASQQGLGVALAALGRVDDGVLALERAIALAPRSADPLYNLGVLRQRQGRDDEALSAFERAARLDAQHVQALYGAALIYLLRGDAREAIVRYRRALAARPGWRPAALELAWVLAVSGDAGLRRPDEALQLAQAVSREDDREARAVDVLAAALAALGRYDEAVSAAQRALEWLPADASAERRAAISRRLELYRVRRPFIESDLR